MFQKGISGNPSGRPIGAKDKKYLNLQYWFNALEVELNKTIKIKEYFANGKMYREYTRDAVDANTRARMFMEGMKMLISKMANLPANSEESVTNASQLMDEIRALEGQFDARRSTEAKSDTHSLEAGPSTVQA